METAEYVRKPFYVQAVQVTEENMHEVAKWCRGEVMPTPEKYTRPGRNGYIAVAAANPMAVPNERHSMAFAGDWVVKGAFGSKNTHAFKVYLPKAFSETFRDRVGEFI